MLYKKQISKEQALQKAKHYCGYQERSHYEVREKLYALGMHKQQVEELISQLIEENYLNEERFAIEFAGGKFRMKQWGRVKIKYELKQKRVSEYCIKKALKQIDEDDYLKTLNTLAKKKWNSIKGDGVNHFVKMSKTTTYLMQKGFETDLIQSAIASLRKED